MTVVYDAKGNEYKVAHQIDIKGWLDAGYTLEAPKVKSKKDKTEDGI